MKKIALRFFVAFIVSWIAGIACLFIALQFSPPRWSLMAMSGALWAAAESSLVYVLPSLLVLTLLAVAKPALSALITCAVACIWVGLTVAWWATSFSPIPWAGAMRNMLILLPGTLVPSLIFYFLLKREK
jgi:hypothetical protein